MPKTKRFTDSIRHEVTLKKDATCSLKLHFYGCLRQYVSALEYKAQIDPERFVYASENYFVEYCKRFSRRAGQGEPYKKRIIRYCKQFLRENGVIGEQVWRVRKGVLRQGFIVAAHDSIAHTDGQTCTILPSSAVSSALASAVPSALASAVSNEENGASECPSECPSDLPQPIDNLDSCGDGTEISFRKVNLVSAPNAVNAVNLREVQGSSVKTERGLVLGGSAPRSASLLDTLNRELETLGHGKG
jgi:hypothetical protein